MNKLENNNIIIEVNEHGAELNKLFSKKHNLDYLWKGDSKYWGRKAPVLFPIVGKLKDNKTVIDGETFSMGQHGFARDSEFSLVNVTEKSLTYSLLSNDETKRSFLMILT